MHPCYTVFTIFAIRYFVPMTTFITPYLIETKHFTNAEIFNNVTPCFFFASLLSSFFGSVYNSYFCTKYTLILNSLLEILCFAIFYYMKPRSFPCAMLTGFLHGAYTSLATQAKVILFSHRPDYLSKENMVTIYYFIKKLNGVLSAWVGQDLKYASGSYQSSLIVSAFNITLSTVLCFFIKNDNNTSIQTKPNLLKIINNRTLIASLKTIYTKNMIYFSALNIVASSLYIAFALYSSSIFIARRKNINPSVHALGKVLFTLSKPISTLTKVIIYFTSFLDSSIKYNVVYARNAIIFGYIDGLSKLVSILCSTLLNILWPSTNYLHCKCFVSTVLVMVFTYCIGVTDSLSNTYLLYVCGSVVSQMSIFWSMDGLLYEGEMLGVVIGMNLMVASVVHIGISCYCVIKGVGVGRKMMVYFWVNSIMLGIAVVIKCVT